MTLYRGTLVYDEPIRTRTGLCGRSGVLAGHGKRNDQEYRRLKHLQWQNNNREHYRTYMREYMRKWRERKRNNGGINT